MITVTEEAATEIKNLIESENKVDCKLRVWVAGGGCSGLSYGMALDDNEPEEDDQIFESSGVKILVDSLSLAHMDGSTVQYVNDSPMNAGFKIENPNAVSTCGCGSSFQTEGSGGCGSGSCGCK